jgi:CubicO group peptidase (beta-lactamase class C family)
MSGQAREFPEQPNLRFLKLEAKRRLTAGEFATLHDAQLAVAREHGLSSWAVLKETVTAGQAEPNLALAQVRWLISRFRDAGSATWARPAAEELREHFTREFLSAVPLDTIIDMLIRPPMSDEDLVVIEAPTSRSVRAQAGGLQVEAFAEADPPHRLTSLQLDRQSLLATDERVAAPPAVTAGQVPAEAMAVAREWFAELGLPGLVVAGADTAVAGTAVAGTADAGDRAWSLALGWASLERPEPLGVRHRFPAYAITQVITATAALRLVAGGLLELDAPANRYLRTVRLADEEVTVRELLNHTSGVDNPENLFGGAITDLISLSGPVMPCSGPRGTVRYSVGGYAVLGQLIADVTGARYQDTAESLVLRPLGMTDSFFPASWPERDAVTGYQLDDAGRFEPASARFCVIPAAGGLWSTAADLARFGAAWGSLLPADLAAEALRPQAPPGSPGPRFGLGWPLHPGNAMAGLVGSAPGAAMSLLFVPGSGHASVAMTNWLIPAAIEQVNARLLRPNP